MRTFQPQEFNRTSDRATHLGGQAGQSPFIEHFFSILHRFSCSVKTRLPLLFGVFGGTVAVVLDPVARGESTPVRLEFCDHALVDGISEKVSIATSNLFFQIFRTNIGFCTELAAD